MNALLCIILCPVFAGIWAKVSLDEIKLGQPVVKHGISFTSKENNQRPDTKQCTKKLLRSILVDK